MGCGGRGRENQGGHPNFGSLSRGVTPELHVCEDGPKLKGGGRSFRRGWARGLVRCWVLVG